MQKAFSLEPHDLQQTQKLDQERTEVLAQIGALTLDMETARASLPLVERKRREHLAGLVQKFGVTEYRSAAIQGNNLVCDLPDPPPQPLSDPRFAQGRVTGIDGPSDGKTNGMAIEK